MYSSKCLTQSCVEKVPMFSQKTLLSSYQRTPGRGQKTFSFHWNKFRQRLATSFHKLLYTKWMHHILLNNWKCPLWKCHCSNPRNYIRSLLVILTHLQISPKGHISTWANKGQTYPSIMYVCIFLIFLPFQCLDLPGPLHNSQKLCIPILSCNIPKHVHLVRALFMTMRIKAYFEIWLFSALLKSTWFSLLNWG